MKIEVGKSYRTQGGNRAVVLAYDDSGALYGGWVYPEPTGESYETQMRYRWWLGDGTAAAGDQHDDDLVAYWLDSDGHEERLQRLDEDIYQIRQNAAWLTKVIRERCNATENYTQRVDERVGELTNRVDQLRDMVHAAFKRIEGIDENLEVWNDELTKVDQTEKATTDSDFDEDKPNYFVDEEFLAKCKKRLYHGFPLTVEQQRELWQQASGEWLERKGRRCPECGGIGLRGERDGLTITGDHPRVELLCNRCNGYGYVSRET